MTYDLTSVFQALLVLGATIVSALVLPYIRSRTTAAQQQELWAWALIAVSAAEQLYSGSGLGAEKKAYVLDWLQKKGFTLDTDTLDALIEAAVYKLKTALGPKT